MLRALATLDKVANPVTALCCVGQLTRPRSTPTPRAAYSLPTRAILAQYAAGVRPLRQHARSSSGSEKGLRAPASVADVGQLLGWTVLNTDLKAIGTVVEVIQQTAGAAGSSPVLRIESVTLPEAGSSQNRQSEIPLQHPVRHLVPWVPAIVQSIRPSDSVIIIAPPAGLLELGHRQQRAEQLGSQLEPYSRAPAGSVAERLGQRFMPTKEALKAAGRDDLIKLVTLAGGFTEVAQYLGLRARRRPQGFWDDIDNLDRELSLFVAGMWTRLAAPDGTYYYNQVTGRQQWAAPQLPQSIPVDDAGTVIFAEEESQRVMPSRAAVLAAGRFDLHHGIMYQGGYIDVAEQLDRPSVWPRHKKYTSVKQLAKALQDFIREHGLPPHLFPSASILRAADRADLLNGINEHGGLFKLKSTMGLATTRGPGWPDSATAGEELQKVAKMIGSDRSIEASIGSVAHMPTMAQLRSAGRKDLVYAVQKFGYYEMAQAARLEVPRRRGRLAKV